MTRTDAMQRLVAVEPLTERDAEACCGWPMGEATRVLRGLAIAGVVRYGNFGTGQRLYFAGRSPVHALRGTGEVARVESLRLGADQRYGEGRAGNVGRMACAAGGSGEAVLMRCDGFEVRA